ncbi:glycerol acyltransferase [Puteibacter caeruleilacunae]|nr:glycerol acyltransferase [Puteibacter caeruleilacunae]
MTEYINTFKPIDIRQLIADKNPKAAASVPNFIIKYLHRIIHVDQVNDFMNRNGHLHGIAFVNKIIEEYNISFNLKGIENVPQTGNYIFASNHPLGGFDGILLMSIVAQLTNRNVKFLVNDFLMNVTPLQELFIPINKVGGQARESLLQIENTYKSDDHILIFPAGLCSRKISGKITDLKWHKHFIQKAVQHKRDIIPIHFEGRNSNFFYNLSRIRKFLGIKFNIEMLYLPDEMYKQQNKTFTITFGEPIPYQTFTKEKKLEEWTLDVREKTYSLAEKR